MVTPETTWEAIVEPTWEATLEPAWEAMLEPTWEATVEATLDPPGIVETHGTLGTHGQTVSVSVGM